MGPTISSEDHKAVLAKVAGYIRYNHERQIKETEDFVRNWKEPTQAQIEECRYYGRARTVDYLEKHKYDILAEIEHAMLNGVVGYTLGFFRWQTPRPSFVGSCSCRSDDYEYEPTPEELAKWEAEEKAQEVRKRDYKAGALSGLFPPTGNRSQVDIEGTTDHVKWSALERWLRLYYGYSVRPVVEYRNGDQSLCIEWRR